MRCTRCGGTGIFYTRIVNMQPIKALPNDGICYKCKGSGVDPYLIDETDILEVINVNHVYEKERLIQVLTNELDRSRKAVCYVLNNMYKRNMLSVKDNNVYFKKEECFMEENIKRSCKNCANCIMNDGHPCDRWEMSEDSNEVTAKDCPNYCYKEPIDKEECYCDEDRYYSPSYRERF